MTYMKMIRAASIVLLLLLTAWMGIGRISTAAGPDQEGYPPPAEATPFPQTGDSEPLIVTVQPYPEPDSGQDPAVPVPIGIQSGDEATQTALAEPVIATAQEANRGLIYLWMGFLATFLVFLTSVAGSIVLFTRRNES